MSVYSGYITTLKQLRPHTNANKLQIATVFGADVIVSLDFRQGQRVVYFPSDGQLSEAFCAANDLVRRVDEDGNPAGGYLDPEKRNIKAIKLRGEKSDGLILPVESLKNWANVDDLKDGDAITVLGGHEICRKYIPRAANPAMAHGKSGHRPGKDSAEYPYFAQHIETEQLAYHESAFHPGDSITLTQKLHGTSFRVSNAKHIARKPQTFLQRLFHRPGAQTEDYRVVSGSRRVVLGDDLNDGWYDICSFRKAPHEFFASRLPKGFTVYGEIVGWSDETHPIMPSCMNSKVKDKEFQKLYGPETTFTYGCRPGQSDFYVYRITVTTEDGETVDLPTPLIMWYCEKWGCKFVPLLERFLYTTWQDLNERCAKYLDVPEPLANGAHVTEGVVVRIENRPKFTAYKTKSYFFKILEGLIKDTTDAPDMEEAQEVTE